ncbi:MULTISPECIES: TatD family hydrolase [unclassified Francisella]|uniref:TatD family hydrolase n=1 Tax=unclassified Francisella TaxID=2610885 RepID=UPI002E3036D9|nr:MULTISPECIES: TatD family hydrolase [unclassified Francisella]MED7820376.1 TatD family hydrolase [Francisella sp. 19S2-4]MED7831211.1 TatD family hydrolase [Francisella sp. 19S2-10]
MLLDSHVHTDKYSLDNFKKVAIECREHNIKLLSVAMCIPSYEKIKALSHEYEFVIPSFGIHPWKAKEYSNNLSSLDEYLLESDLIGEIGLDKKFLKYASPYKDQLEVFEYIISHHSTKNKFLNLHTSGAEIEVVNFLEKYNCNKFMVHWYAGDLDIIDNYLALGGFFSIGVEILFSKHIQSITKKLPLDRILVETDNPSAYSWLLGKELNNGMPTLLFRVVDKICEVKRIVIEEFLTQLKKNQTNILTTTIN